VTLRYIVIARLDPAIQTTFDLAASPDGCPVNPGHGDADAETGGGAP
jgi:hypothetical protein